MSDERLTRALLAVVALSSAAGPACRGSGGSPAGPSDTSPRVVASRTLTANGGRVDWCAATNRIAFDRVTGSGQTEVYSIRPDGTDERCVTCGSPDGLPSGVRGNPAWHPSGGFLVIQAQARSYDGNRFQFLSFGIDNALWLVAADGSWAEPLVSVGPCEGSLHPHFSDSGDRLFWAARSRTGAAIPQSPIDPTPCEENPWDGWHLEVATFARPSGGPAALGAPADLYPNEGGFFESHALRGDTIWFSHTDGGRAFVDDSYSARADGGRTNLTRSPTTWDEHAQPSPGGRAFAFASSRSFAWTPLEGVATLRLELWASVDGGSPVRLTDLNAGVPAATRALASDFAWGPSGRDIVLYHADLGLEASANVVEILTLDKAY